MDICYGVLAYLTLVHQPEGTVASSHSSSLSAEDFSHESRLVTHLLDKYRRLNNVPRPVRNSSVTLNVEFAVALIQVLDFDETNQVLTTNVWKRYRWVDEVLMWNPDDFGGLTDIRLPSEDIWSPDIVLYNNADFQEKKHQELVAVYHYGKVRWIPPAIYKSSCQIDMKNFPFDEQTCHLKFGSWTYDGFKLNLSFYDEMDDLDLREYMPSSEWDITNHSAEYSVRYYPCCGDEPYPDITFQLTVKRKTAFFIYVLILPSVLLSFLTLVLFWIPPQRPDRTSLGMSLFGSFFVLLLILVQASPPSASVSLLGVYYCINMIMIAVSTMISAVVINMTYYIQKKPIPRVLRLVVVDCLSRLLCAQTENHAPQKAPTNIEEARTPLNRKNVTHQNGGGGGADSGTDSTQGGDSRGFMMNDLETRAAIRLSERASKQRSRVQEWRIFASVIDRLFFIIYLVGLTFSLIFVFPR